MAADKTKTVKVAKLPGEACTINALERGAGIVIDVSVGLQRTLYQVAYWHNGDRKTAWLTEGEIS